MQVSSTTTEKLPPTALSGPNSTVSLTVNGTPYTVTIGQNGSSTPSNNPPIFTTNTSLVDFIRNHTKYSGTKAFCHEGGCGACAVSLTYQDGTTGKTVTKTVHSCLRPLLSCHGASITTNDGLVTHNANDATPIYHPVQKALAASNGSQCGYCSNGFVMTMYGLLSEQRPTLSALDIENEFDGNLCRCTGYRPIMAAMSSFAKSSNKETHHHCEEEDCRTTGCKNKGKPFVDLEEVSSKLLGENGNYHFDGHRVAHPTTVAMSKNKLSVQVNGQIWQDCPTLDDLNFWLKWYSTNGTDVMLVVAQTSMGIFWGMPTVRLNIADIPEFLTITKDANGVNIGPNVTVSNLLNYLNTCTATHSYQTAHFPQAVRHLKRVGSVLLRNAASVMGNIAITHQNQSADGFFCSDIATLFYALGVTYQLVDPKTGTSINLTQDQLFQHSLKGKYVKQITIPWAAQNEIFMTYKMAQRQANSHSIVNAGMKAIVDPNTGMISSTIQPTIVIGGIEPRPTRYAAVEQKMMSMVVTTSATANGQTLANQLFSLLNPAPFTGKLAYRKSLAVNFFFKFWLKLQPSTTLPSNLQSATECWMMRTVSTGTQSYQGNPNEYPVSYGMPKIEAIQQTSGNAKYTADLTTPEGLLHASLVLASAANCDIDTVDITQAQKSPGFLGYFDHTNLPASVINANPPLWNTEVFSSGPILYNGQAIGVVIATTAEYAWQAADKINITYKNQKPLTVTIEQALNTPGKIYPPSAAPAPVTKATLHPKSSCHVSKSQLQKLSREVVRGDVQKGFEESDVVVQGTAEIGYQYHFHLENHVTMIVPREDVLEVYSATQMPLNVQSTIATALSIPCSKVTTRTKRCGGGFGGKLFNSLYPALIAALCYKWTGGAPIRLQMDLFKTTALLGNRSAKRVDYKAGVGSDGTINSLQATVSCVAGPNPSSEFGTAMVLIHSLDNCYKIPHVNFSAQLLNLDIPVSTSVRGPGWIPAVQLCEMIISNIASQLNMDAKTIREKNFLQQGDTTADNMALPFFNISTIWSTLQTQANYSQRVTNVAAFNSANRWRKRGLAMTPVRFGVGYSGANYDSLVNIYADGTIAVTHGGTEIGQGINTKVIQVVGMCFGLSVAELKLVTCNETCSRQLGGATDVTGGSITSELCVLSVMHACQELNRRLAPFRSPGQPWQAVVAAASATAAVELTATGWSAAPPGTSGMFNYNSTSAALAEVEIDVLSGQYEIRQVDIVFDCGISLNPIIDIGQVEGGFVFGQGYALQEVVEYDPNTGESLNSSTWEYKPPCAYDVPEVMNTTLLPNSPNPLGVLGAKACGEPGVGLAACAVHALEAAVNEARAANGLSINPRWVVTKLPLTVDQIQAATGTTISNFAV